MQSEVLVWSVFWVGSYRLVLYWEAEHTVQTWHVLFKHANEQGIAYFCYSVYTNIIDSTILLTGFAVSNILIYT